MSENPSVATARLIATGPAGVEIQFVDAFYKVRERGTVRLEATLPEGLYYVKWQAGGQSEQKLVRLLAIEKPLEVSGGLFTEAQPISALQEAVEAARPQTRGECAVLVLAQVCDGAEAEPDLANIRLIDDTDTAMRAEPKTSRPAAQRFDLGSGNVARLYQAPPGNYRLRYRSVTGDTLDQTVCALAGWRTIVSLQIDQSLIFAPGAEGAKQSHKGVDPSATIIACEPLGARGALDPELLRLAAILLADLKGANGSLSAALISQLSGPDIDPLLKLYAAASILSSLDRNGWPALDEIPPATQEQRKAAVAAWTERARGLIAPLQEHAFLPDLTPLLWRLNKGNEVEPAGIPKAVSHPPMLECAWLWAVERSVHHREAVERTPLLEAASSGRAQIAPWLVWRARASLGSAEPAPLSPAKEAFAKTLNDVASAMIAPGATGILAVNPLHMSRLSPITQAVVAGAGAAIGAMDPIGALARTIGVPASLLNAHSERILDEIRSVDETSGSPDDPPALLRPILSRDDPNKGRFGGQASRGGFALSASFDDEDPDWIGIELTVTAGPEAGELTKADKALFFLHDSFDPDQFKIKFGRRRRASLDISAYGGFTVGVWLKSRRIELELDLAELSYAPEAIKLW